MARICVVRQGYFPFDPRVRREVATLVDADHHVDVICLRGVGEARLERSGTLPIRRLPPRRRRLGSARYVFEYAAFLVLATVWVRALHLRRRYDLVQVNTLPDPLVFAAAVPKLTGTPVLVSAASTAGSDATAARAAATTTEVATTVRTLRLLRRRNPDAVIPGTGLRSDGRAATFSAGPSLGFRGRRVHCRRRRRRDGSLPS